MKHPCASNAKLTPEQVKEIRARLTSYGMGKVLAKEYGVAQSTITAIKRNYFWRGVK